MIGALKQLLKRHWPSLSLRAILFGTLLFVAALPGFAALFLRVYENTLVQQTEAELIAEGAVIASAYRVAWGAPGVRTRPSPEPPQIDLRSNPILPSQPDARAAPPADRHALAVARQLAPIVDDAAAVTLAATRLLDRDGIVVGGLADRGMSYAALPEVRRALAGHSVTVLRRRIDTYDRASSAIELLSKASAIRVHHVRPVMVDGRVIGAVMLSRSPRGIFLGIYQDRGKIMLGVALIFMTLVVLAGLLSRGIARPIRALTAATTNVAQGRIDIPEPPVTAAIEIRELYVNFALMAERIEARARYLRDFAAAVSHEFKTPLAGIRGAIELLDDHGADMAPGERARFLANAAADADRLSRLVQRLLDMARADMTSVADDVRCDAALVARTVADSFGDPGRRVAVTAPSDLPQVRMAGDALETILTTLIDNSRQAGASAIDVILSRVGGDVMIRVSDDGSGIPAADQARVFEPFFTGNRARGGTGLGLPIARSLIGATGGTIQLVAAAKGTTLLLTLPADAVAVAR